MYRWIVLGGLMVTFSLRLVAQVDSAGMGGAVKGYAMKGGSVKDGVAADSAAVAREIIRLEQLLMDALPGDAAPWNRYLAPNWYATTEDGTGFFKEAFLRTFGAFPKGFSGNIRVTKPVLVFHDDVAVIHYVADEHETVYGQQLHTTYGTVDTWYKKDSSWMMLSMLQFEIPQLPPAVRVRTAVLQQYTGTYRLSAESSAAKRSVPESLAGKGSAKDSSDRKGSAAESSAGKGSVPDRLAVVSLQRDTLFIRKGDSPREPLFAETERVFFRQRDTRGRKIFVRDGSGKMIMRERRNGQDLVWKRVP